MENNKLPYQIKKSIIQKDDIGLFIIAFGTVIRTFNNTPFKEKDIVKIKFNHVGLDCYITPYDKKLSNFYCFHKNRYEIWIKTFSTNIYFFNKKTIVLDFLNNKTYDFFY